MSLSCCRISTGISKSAFEVADIFNLYDRSYQEFYSLSFRQRKVMYKIKSCRTAVLGGHIDRCDSCGYEKNSYNSCRDRHCPKCQTLAKEEWLDKRKEEILPTGYFHNVFTLPHDLNPIILCNKKVTLDILFKAVKETLQAFACDPQWRLVGQLGFIVVLHTWNQILLDHFHLHCLIPAGVLSHDKKEWIASRKKYLFRVQSLAKEFRKCYLRLLEQAYKNNKLIFPGKTEKLGTQEVFSKLIEQLKDKKKDWIVYSKHPFAGPEQVLEYLGRYTHRVAISNNRIKSINDGTVTFTYKDRADDNKIKKFPLDADEFIRRFLLHILPDRFIKIRYFGFLAHRNKNENILLIRHLINKELIYPAESEDKKESVPERMLRLTGKDITLCPKCRKGHLVKIAELSRLPVHYSKYYDSS